MHIANPIYDVVFRYMMEDSRVAKAFLSAIIQEEVVELDFAPQEHTIRVSGRKETQPAETNFTVCRFDFSARISVPDGGYKTVLIELQKAKLSSDIMRFRRYLGLHYQNPDNAYGPEEARKARQIYCIFLLGYDIDVPDTPVIRVALDVTDVTTSKALSVDDNEFIQGMHHRSWIIQIGQLKNHRRTDLEKLLSIFDQDNRNQNHHILNVNENSFPKACRSIIRRLRMASESEKIQTEMEMEDDYLKELQDREREITRKEKALEETLKALEEKDKTIEDQGKALGEKDKTIEEQEKALEAQMKEIENLRKQLSENTGRK